MKSGFPHTWRRLVALLGIPQPEPAQIVRRIRILEVDIMLPLKVAAVLLLTQSVYFPVWTHTLAGLINFSHDPVRTAFWQGVVRSVFWYYLAFSALIAGVLLYSSRLPLAVVQWIPVVSSLVDCLFLGVLTLVTGGYDSPIFWLFFGLIIRNAIAVPQASKQQALNLTISLFYAISAIKGTSVAQSFPEDTKEMMGAAIQQNYPASELPVRRRGGSTNVIGGDSGSMASPLNEVSRRVLEMTSPEDVVEPVFTRLMVLWLTAACCHAFLIMIERYRLTSEESREFATRESQLRSAGRVAAQIAHQIKNPLAIINNAAFTLRHVLKDTRPDVTQAVGIIQEEVSRADQIITQLMGYAQLSEGRVEKLDVREELDRAIREVFPPGVQTGIRIKRDYEDEFPPLLMQRGHLSEIISNLLQNAREALDKGGNVTVTARCRRDYSVEVNVQDDGPGVAPDKRERIFEAYYTTKARGTGLGLAIVKQNVELYGGTVAVESELGKGARFVLLFPAKTLIKFG